MNKSIYSLVLSDEVVEAVDELARTEGASRSAMINRILAERVAFTTPEMRLRDILQSLARAMNGEFMLEQPTGSTLICRTSLKYRYKPTVKYSVEIYSENGRRAGELRVSFRTRNAQLIDDLMGFFRCWAALEQRYIADRLSNDIVYTISDGRFERTLNMPSGQISDDELGTAVAEYMAMFDGAMKAYFAQLPDTESAALAAEGYYRSELAKQRAVV
ncbi:MAG: ribbon-helix-helix domain-containing protein [Lachnospiraceae bacterium]|nr:ribbon-helix-helix domain-containing protein [Ruminococcus sp.]MCM1274923.1 ribbon-helix-helix domain-containing protein [Lachnospiraceae bacterium]